MTYTDANDLFTCRMKDVNKHAPKELKAYTDCIDSHGCGRTIVQCRGLPVPDLTSSLAGYAALLCMAYLMVLVPAMLIC